MTIIKSIEELDTVRAMLESENSVKYWDLKFSDSCYSLTIIGEHLKNIVQRLKQSGYIVEVF